MLFFSSLLSSVCLWLGSLRGVETWSSWTIWSLSVEREREREILYEEKKFRGPFEVIVIYRGIVVKNPACWSLLRVEWPVILCFGPSAYVMALYKASIFHIIFLMSYIILALWLVSQTCLHMPKSTEPHACARVDDGKSNASVGTWILDLAKTASGSSRV